VAWIEKDKVKAGSTAKRLMLAVAVQCLLKGLCVGKERASRLHEHTSFNV
jgi:hypothetical protein